MGPHHCSAASPCWCRWPSPMDCCPQRAPHRLCIDLAFNLFLLLSVLCVSSGSFARPLALLTPSLPLSRAGARVEGESVAGAACAVQKCRGRISHGWEEGSPAQPCAVGAGGGTLAPQAGWCLSPIRGLTFSEVGLRRLQVARSSLKPSPKNKVHV